MGKQQLRSRERTEIRKRAKASPPERITAGERHVLPAPDRAAASGRTEEGKAAACGHSPAPSPETPAKASLSSASVWELGSGALCPPPQGVYPKRRWRLVRHGVSQMGLTVAERSWEEQIEKKGLREPGHHSRTWWGALQMVLKPATVWRPDAGLLSEEPVNLFSKSWYTGPSPKRLAGHSSQSSSHPRRRAEPDPRIIPMLHFLLASLVPWSSQCHSQECPGSCEKWGADLVASV